MVLQRENHVGQFSLLLYRMTGHRDRRKAIDGICMSHSKCLYSVPHDSPINASRGLALNQGVRNWDPPPYLHPHHPGLAEYWMEPAQQAPWGLQQVKVCDCDRGSRPSGKPREGVTEAESEAERMSIRFLK